MVNEACILLHLQVGKTAEEAKRVINEWPESHNNHRLCHPQKPVLITYLYCNDLICMFKFLLKEKHKEAKHQGRSHLLGL